MEIKQLIEAIVREMAGQLQASVEPEKTVPPPKVLYVFEDGTAHEAYTDHFILLHEHGISHDLMFLDGTVSAWLGKHRIECGGPGKVIAVDEFAPAPLEVPLAYDGIIVPELDLDTIGRAALGIRGTVLSDVLFSALVAGRFVLAGEDSSGLKRADRRTLKKLGLPETMLRLYKEYQRKLAELGAIFGPKADLAKLAAGLCSAASAEKSDRGLAASDRKDGTGGGLATGVVRFEGKFVSADWVERQFKLKQPGGQLTLSRGTLLSPLAKDLLKDRGITVHYADERQG